MKNSTDDLDGNRKILGPTFSVWDIAETDISIHLHLSTVEWLDYEITRSFTMPEGRGEVGGLLLGRIEVDSRRRVVIEGFTPVPCEYRFGSAYHLSGPDKRLLKDQMARWQPGPGRNLYLVGYYRSQNREAVSLDEEDVLLAKEYFPDSLSAVLLIRPSQIRLGLGAFFFCEDGRVELESKLRFPLSRTKLAQRVPAPAGASVVELRTAQPDVRPVRTDHPAPVPESLPESAPIRTAAVPSVPFQPPRARRSLPWRGVAAILALVLGGLGYNYLYQYKAPEALDHALAELDLTAAVEKNSLRISWNRTAPAIASARQAILSIADRSSRTQLTLSPEQLQAGGLVYPHESDDVTVRLRIVTPERDTTESARVIRAARQAESPARPPVQFQVAANKRVEVPPDIAVSKKPGADSTLPAVQPAGTAQASYPPDVTRVSSPGSETAELSEPVPPAAAADTKPAPSSLPLAVKEPDDAPLSATSSPETQVLLPRREAAEANVQQPPATSSAGQPIAQKSLVVPTSEPRLPPLSESPPRVAEPVRLPEETAQPPAQSPPVTARNETIRSETSKVPDVSSPAAGNSVAGGAQGLSAGYVAPQAVRRVTPHLPSSLRNLPVAGLQVEVKVYIDADGKVVRTEPISKGNNLEEYLSVLAADAARQWRFSPARRGNQNVPSETILHFKFSK